MKSASHREITEAPKASTLDAELLATIEAGMLAIKVRDEAELHRQLAIRVRLMNELRDMLSHDVDKFSSLTFLHKAASLETKLIAEMHAWRNELLAQLDNIANRKRLVMAYDGE